VSRLLYLSSSRFPSARAHARQIVEMCAAFAEQGRRVTLAYPDLPARPPVPRSADLFDYCRLPRRFRTLRLPCAGLPEIFGPEPDFVSRWWRLLAHGTAGAWALARVLREPRREPLVVYSREKYGAFLTQRLVRRSNLRLLLEIHDLWRPLTPANRSFLERAHGLVVIHPALRDDLVAEGISPDSILVEPDAIRRVQKPVPREAARKALGLEIDGSLVAYTGHLYPDKGAEVLVRAMAEIPEATALIVGGVEADRERVQAEIRSENVRLIDHVPPARAALYQAAADVLVLPTVPLGDNPTRYTSPLKLAEYRAANRPVVASDVPSLREWLVDGETARLVPAADPAALASAIRGLLADPGECARLARNARAGMEDETWSARARRILEFAARGPGASPTAR